MKTAQTRSPVTTHVLDIHRGKPAAGIAVALERLERDGQWKPLARSTTNADGRVEDLLAPGARIDAGSYQLVFETRPYFEGLGTPGFYPRVAIAFEIRDPAQHYHVPLLLSAHGYSTYRGT